VVTWSPPTNQSGLITKYNLRVYQIDPSRLDIIDVTNDAFRKKIDKLNPATRYHVTIETMTSAGSVNSNPLDVKTLPAGE